MISRTYNICTLMMDQDGREISSASWEFLVILIVEPAMVRRGRLQLDPLAGLGREHHQRLGSGHG